MYQLCILSVLNVLQISRCRQVWSNEVDPHSDESTASDEENFNAPVVWDIGRINYKELDNYGDDVYSYRSYPRNTSVRSSEDLRRCSGGNCGKFVRKRPASKDYPTNMHCRGILAYCRKQCVALSTKICGDWIFLCPGNTVGDLPKRCAIQCIHNYRQMRLKFPAQAKLSKFVNPRYDRFDYY